jgi:DnaJ like chaperone protein
VNWWGKLVGGTFGFILGGPLGALLGAAIGHQLDKGQTRRIQGNVSGRRGIGERERIQSAFFTATFAVLGKVAKADGRVSPNEIALAEAIMARMDLSEELRQTAIELFRQAKNADFPLDPVLDQLRQECHGSQHLLRMFLAIQLQAAYADGHMDRTEESLLLHICHRLGVSELAFRQIEALVRAEREFSGRGQVAEERLETANMDQAYAILGISPATSDEEVTKAYRRLRSQHHPDKLASQGLPEEMMRLASQKSHEIRMAYEQIMAERGRR